MKDFIAKDTKQPLVVLGGYRIGEGGSIIRETIVQTPRKTASKEDRELFEQHGIDGLRDRGMWGIIDRLQVEGEDRGH